MAKIAVIGTIIMMANALNSSAIIAIQAELSKSQQKHLLSTKYDQEAILFYSP